MQNSEEANDLIVLINGAPGAGKLTIGRMVAQAQRLRLLDNHTLLNPAASVFDRDDPLYWPLRTTIRSAVLDHLARQAKPLRVVLTDALAAEIAPDRTRFDDIAELARSARLLTVVLECGLEENARRFVSPGRSEHRKLMDVSVLARLRARCPLLRPTVGGLIEIDITQLRADETAQLIVARLAEGTASRVKESGGSKNLTSIV
jgi:AAA domain